MFRSPHSQNRKANQKLLKNARIELPKSSGTTHLPKTKNHPKTPARAKDGSPDSKKRKKGHIGIALPLDPSFPCTCSACTEQAKHKKPSENKKNLDLEHGAFGSMPCEEELDFRKYETLVKVKRLPGDTEATPGNQPATEYRKKFNLLWLMERLIPINDKIRGCRVNFPETVFFHKGKPKIMIKTDKEGSLICAGKSFRKISLHQIKTTFSSIILKRKLKLNTSIGLAKKKFQNINNSMSESSIFYIDTAILCLKGNKIKILNNKDFITIFSLRENEPYWNSVKFVQSNVKSKIGIGKKIPFLFLFDMEMDNSENENPNEAQLQPKEVLKHTKNIPLKEYEEINYIDSQVEDISQLQGKQLCYQYCLRIGYYLQKVHGIEILMMTTEFTIDDDGVLWLTDARDISVRFRRNPNSSVQLHQLSTISKTTGGKPFYARKFEGDKIDFSGDTLDENDEITIKMNYALCHHYHELKSKLGLDGKHEETQLLHESSSSNIYPDIVLRHMEEERLRKIRRENQFKIKTRDELSVERKQIKTASSIPKGYNTHLASQELRMLKNHLSASDSYSLVDPDDVRFVRKNLSSIAHKNRNNISNIYEPPLKHSFLKDYYQENFARKKYKARGGSCEEPDFTTNQPKPRSSKSLAFRRANRNAPGPTYEHNTFNIDWTNKGFMPSVKDFKKKIMRRISYLKQITDQDQIKNLD
ncbi:unnamed protein product [Moneuplotes crassus]|uniref:Uncharacterized protein n=1 Tax=Euplotes crassus TaxID=5936 RepID=A0AAD2D8U4_EUPCR|nr:unnamed protein product [Moneuplotes crassus]